MMNAMLKRIVSLVTLTSFLWGSLAIAAPDGGQVAAGSATISQTGSTTTINQATQNTVINWNNFNTSASESVQFNQPNNSAIALNRITSGLPTQFDGALAANGHVWIVNPAGVVFGASSRIDVAGLVATTLNITDNNFMNGNYKFDFVPGFENSKIINNGLISARDSGLVVLVAPGVENNGVIIANLGKVVLASGSAFTLDLYGDNLINFGTSAPVDSGYVSQTGLISARGGKVFITANSAGKLLDNVISMSGVIEAKTATTGEHGEIILNGGHAGNVKISGTLDASDGGYVETSGYSLDFSGMTLKAGKGGTWYIDPVNVEICLGGGCTIPGYTDIDPATIVASLQAGTNVTIDTATQPGLPGVGDLLVSQDIDASAGPLAGNLTLRADHNLIINALIKILGNFTATGNTMIETATSVTAALSTFNSAIISDNGSSLNVFGNAVFNGEIGQGGFPLNTLGVTGQTTINTDAITTVQVQNYNSVLLQQSVTLQGSFPDVFGIVFGGAIDNVVGTGPWNLTLQTPSTSFSGNIGTVNGALGTVTVTESPLNLGDKNAYLFGAANTFNVATINFGGFLLDPAQTHNLVINGAAIFGDIVGGNNPMLGGLPANPLASLTVNGVSTINTLTIHTTGVQSYNGGANLPTGTVNFDTAGNILTFGGTVSGINNNLITANPLVFNGPGTRTVNSLAAGTTTTINGGTIAATTTQLYSGAVTLGNAAINLSGSTITFNNSVNGPAALTITGNLILANTASIGSGTSLSSLFVTGTSSGVNVTTTGDQTYVGPFTLTTNDVLRTTTGNITFFSTVTGPFNLTLLSALGNFTFDGAVNVNSLLAVTGSSFINGPQTIFVNAPITTSAPGYSLILASDIFNAGAAGALNPGGNFQVWTIAPYSNNENGIARNFNQFLSFYGITAVGSLGNGFLYRVGNGSSSSVFSNPSLPNILAGATLPDEDAFFLSDNIEIINLTNREPVGIVFCLCGFVTAIDPLGNIRILQAGDKIYAGDRVEDYRDNQTCRTLIEPFNPLTLAPQTPQKKAYT